MTESAKHVPAPWHLEPFDETGGYDCMTGAWTIKAASQTDPVVVVDQDNYGQRHLAWDYRSEVAEATARLIVRAPVMDAAIRNYLAAFDACGGAEAVSAERFAEARQMLRDALVDGECVDQDKTK